MGEPCPRCGSRRTAGTVDTLMTGRRFLNCGRCGLAFSPGDVVAR